MRIAIIGSRNYGNIDFAKEIEKRIIFHPENDTIISGGAIGIDTLAANYAKERNMRLLEFKPDYRTHGRAATFIRNRAIVDNADLVVAFWDGFSRGTKYTIDYARKKGITTFLIMPS